MRCQDNPDHESHDLPLLSRPLSASDRAATEAAENIIACRCEIVAVARLTHCQRHRRAGTAQHVAAVEPRRRVVVVGVGAKSGVGQEAAGGSFPDLAPFVAFVAFVAFAACVGAVVRRGGGRGRGDRWLGGRPHAATRRRIQRADLLMHASRMEGGAQVVMAAVCSGTPVIASAMAGNIGMLGRDYAGYYNCGDAQGLAALLVKSRASQGQRDGLLARLAAQCRPRALLVSARGDRLAAS